MPIRSHVDSYKTQANPLNAAFDAIEPLNYVDNSNPPSIFSKLDLQTIGGTTWFGLLNSKAVGRVHIEQLGTKRGAIAWQVCFSADGRYLAVSYLSVAVKVYDVRTAQSVCEINDPTLNERNEPGCILAICLSSDARSLVTGGRDGIIRIWDIHTRSLDLPLNRHKHSVVSLSYARNGTKLVSGSADGTIWVWDFICGTARDVAGEDSMSVAISPSAHLVAAASLDSIVRVWDANSGVLLQRLRGHMGGVTSIAFTPDGTGLVTGSADHTVMYWDLEDTQLNSDTGPEAPVDRYQSTRCFVGHKDTVTCVAISRDGRCMISGGWDGTVRFWNLETTVLHLLLRGHTDTVKSVDFGLDGDFATGSFDGRVGICELDSLNLMLHADSLKGNTPVM
ncbi:WD40 repeat-like protein [Peniophora sp. CONT]|nr:WD40 repeat-like protein [Peniophora sp. CONT]